MAGPTLVIASKNPGKIREFTALFSGLALELKSLLDFPELPEVVEDGLTFLDNARKKAQAVLTATGLAALADDSGLEVAALGGRPGVFSARYAADRTHLRPPTDRDNYLKLLEEMAAIPWERRQARFVCVIVLALPHGREIVAQGVCEGYIALEPRGQGGFGYDPVFWLPQYRCTMAEVELATKNRISHRAAALVQLRATLEEALAQQPELFSDLSRDVAQPG